MAWNGLRMTVDGRNALNQAQMADKMLFKSIVVGDGQAPANFNTQRALVHQLYEITAIQVDVRGDMCVLTADFPAVDYDYYFREIGVVAQTEDGDKLYVYDNCGEDAQYIVTTTGTEKTRKRIRISLKISDVAEITVVNPEILCVAYDDFDKLVEKVKEKVAAIGGDVASTIASVFTESKDPYPIPQAGESIKVILGKVVKFFNDVKTGCCKIGDIVNNCTSTDTDKPLAAAVGKVLWDKIVDAVSALGTHKSSADHDGRYYTETEMDTKLGGKSSTGHTHDDRYYTESEINTKLDGKSNTNHGHSGMLVTGDVVDNCTSTATNKPLSAKQGKTLWDKITDAVSALATHKSSGDHDGRYYTESEINTKLGGKSDTSHNHDSSYVKKHTVAEVSGIQVGKKETNGYGWIDIYYKGVHEFSIYAENSGTGLIIKPALPLSTRHQYVNVLCQLQQKGNLVVDSGRIVDNCTSDVTYNVLSANQGRILMNKCNQLNSDKLDKSSSSQLVTAKTFSMTESFKSFTTDKKIPTVGFLQLIFDVGLERYSIFFDTIRNIDQAFPIGQNQSYNFYLKLRIISDTSISVCVSSLKGYALSDFANKQIWLRSYYAA